MFDAREIEAEGTPHPIRRLQRGDADRIAAFVTALDRETLNLRFGRFMSAEAIQAHYAGLDWNGVVLLAWEIGAEIAAVAEVYLYRNPSSPRPKSIEAEIALVVARGSRGRGIGRILLASGVATAARHGAFRSTMLLSAREPALARMARELGFTTDAAGDRVVFAHHDEIAGH